MISLEIVLIFVFWGPLNGIASPSKVVQHLKFDEITRDIIDRLEHSNTKIDDVDVRNAVKSLNATLRNFNEFHSNDNSFATKDEKINGRIGVLLFTRFCGPGARLLNKFFKTDQRTFARIDVCCQMHDECPNYVNGANDYRKYPGLEQRLQIFSRLQCSCDAEFYQCLQNIDATYAYAVGVGYSFFQRYCFEYEHPIQNCTQYYSGFGMRRCMVYYIDRSQSKTWQWFDVLPPYLEIYNFPQLIHDAFSFV